MRKIAILSFLIGFFGAVAFTSAWGENNYPDKRLARSMELYRLETGVDSPEVKAQLAAKDAEKEQALKAKDAELEEARQRLAAVLIPGGGKSGTATATGLRDTLAQSQPVARQRESGPTQDPLTPFVLKKGSIVDALSSILAKPLPDGHPGYQLVWRGPHYPVIEDFEIFAPDSLGVLDQVISAYNREGVALEWVLYSGNNVVEVGLGGFRQRSLATEPLDSSAR